MKLQEQCELWLEELEREMGDISILEPAPIERLKMSVSLVDGYLEKLRKYVQKQPFKSIEDEIYFFKKVKPEFYNWRIYAFERYGVESWIPITNEQNQREFFISELKALDRFFRLHDFHYQYFRMGAFELDSLFFVRSVQTSDSTILPNVADPDPEFATRGDYLFSKFMALERLRSWVVGKILALDGMSPQVGFIKSGSKLKWTGESINLIEVAYGFWLTGQINNGNASVSEIVRWLEETLQISIGRAYRRWTEISRRERSTATKYLDRMRETISDRLDSEDALSNN